MSIHIRRTETEGLKPTQGKKCKKTSFGGGFNGKEWAEWTDDCYFANDRGV